ncbi:MAG: hypothetical protein O3A10_16460, partial [Chloroflexi bacterium]|nr:hypothetical protein [Chloroflexota bacterium]
MTEPQPDPQLQVLFDACERALAARDWPRLDALAARIIEVDPSNEAALGLRALAARNIELPETPSAAAADATPSPTTTPPAAQPTNHPNPRSAPGAAAR